MFKKVICPLLLSLLLLAGCTGQPQEEIPVSTEDALMCDSVVYYEQASGGYLVPVLVKAAWSEDIAETLANKLVSSDTTDLALEDAGLTGLLPTGTKVTVSMDGSNASVDVSSSWLEDVSDKRAKNIVSALVNTVGQFDAVETVSISLNGKSEKLGCVDISEPFTSVALNPAYAPEEGQKALTVFYKTADSGLMVPVTKYAGEITPEVVVKALMKPHKDKETLMTLFPEGTELRSAELAEDGTLNVDFSKELLNIADDAEKEKKLLVGIETTCKQIEGVKKVNITVQGEAYTGKLQQTMATVAVYNDVFQTEANTGGLEAASGTALESAPAQTPEKE